MNRKALLGAALLFSLLGPARADEPSTYDLRYKFAPGETVRRKVVHLVTIETKIRGVTEMARTRSTSTKVWKIEDVDDDGNITFVHMVDDVEMWQKTSGRQEIRYNSATGADPPPAYEHVAESLGKPLATIKMSPYGSILSREDARPMFNPGIGELTVPLPEEPAAIGASWNTPDEIRVRLKDGRVERIKVRQLYTLDKVQTGVATIHVKTQVLTPVDDPQVRSQLVQRLQSGHIKFDIDAGRVVSKQMDLDETVLGFQGGDSIMEYLARFTEESLPAETNTAEKSEGETTR